MADLLTVDGVDLHGQGFGASTRQGRYSIPSLRGDNTVLPGMSGSRWVANKPYEEGLGALTIWAVGASTDIVTGEIVIPGTYAEQRRQLEYNASRLMRLFTRPHRLSLIRAGQPDHSVRRAYVEWKEWSDPEVQAGGTRMEGSISYVIPGVWWEDENTTTQSAVAGAGLPKTLSLTAFTGMTGIISDALLQVTGPISNPTITDSETGAWVQAAVTLGAGEVWTVDAGASTSVTSAKGSVVSSTTHVGNYKMMVIPNCYGNTDTPQLVLSGSGGGATTNLSVTARRKWVSG